MFCILNNVLCSHILGACGSQICYMSLEWVRMVTQVQGSLVTAVLNNIQSLGCSLINIELSGNHLSGTSGPALTALSTLQSLSLASNQIYGSFPTELLAMANLRQLILSSNSFSGPVPQTLCRNVSMISNLLISNNKLSGSLSWLKDCDSLIMLEANNNRFSGDLGELSTALGDTTALRTLLLAHNELAGNTSSLDTILVQLPYLVDLDISGNHIVGSTPSTLSALQLLNELSFGETGVQGTVSPSLFYALTRLSSLLMPSNALSGLLPSEIGQAQSLTSLNLSNNSLSGSVPGSITNSALVQHGSWLDLRYNHKLSCCSDASGSTVVQTLGLSGYSVNSSDGLSRLNSSLLLPKGISFAPTYQIVAYQDYNLRCPLLQIENSSATGSSGGLLNWFLDPEYYLFQGCTCEDVTLQLAVNFSTQGLIYASCIQLQLLPPMPSPTIPDNNSNWWQQDWWIFIIIALAGATLIVVVVWLFCFQKGRRPEALQNLLDYGKRMKMPRGGDQVSIVVTDIQGFSELMKKNQDATLKASQILLSKQHWPHDLFKEKAGPREVPTPSPSSALKPSALLNKSILQGIGSRITFFTSKQDVSAASQPSMIASSNSCEPSDGILLQSTAAGGVPGAMEEALEGSTGPQSPHQQYGGQGLVFDKNSSSQFRQPPEQCRLPSKQIHALNTRICHLEGLKVRMGVATGKVPPEIKPSASAVLELAKIVSDAATGGQILMCSSTFAAVQNQAEELGCVNQDGMNYGKLYSLRPPWYMFWRRKKRQEEAVLIDMGLYINHPSGPLPDILTPYFYPNASETWSLRGRSEMNHSSLINPPVLSTLEKPTGSIQTSPQSNVTRKSVTPHIPGVPQLQRTSLLEAGSTSSSTHLQRMYQVLAPNLVSRGRYFGSTLSLKDDWYCLDSPYFDAPSTLHHPLSHQDLYMDDAGLPPVTMVFCAVEDGKMFSSKDRRAALVLQMELEAAMMSVMRQVPSGYLVRHQEAELKYIAAFGRAEDALCWCLAVQECSMYLEWSVPVLRAWPSEEKTGGKGLLFRGPRLKMGVCEGVPSSISPDYVGRADYIGASVNQAARYMDAAAHGGQVACERSLAHKVFHTWSQRRTSVIKEEPDEHTSGAVLRSHTTTNKHEDEDQGHHLPSPSRAIFEERSQNGNREMSVTPDLLADASKMSVNALSENVQQQRQVSKSVGCASNSVTPVEIKEEVGLHEVKNPFFESNSERGETFSSVAVHPENACEIQGDPSSYGPQVSSQGVTALSATAPHAKTSLWAASMTDTASQRLRTLGSEEFLYCSSSSHCVALNIGQFWFKGCPDSLDMVNVTFSFLEERRYPRESPRGKGLRLLEGHGVSCTAEMPKLAVVHAYRIRYEEAKRADVARNMEKCGSVLQTVNSSAFPSKTLPDPSLFSRSTWVTQLVEAPVFKKLSMATSWVGGKKEGGEDHVHHGLSMRPSPFGETSETGLGKVSHAEIRIQTMS
ncbi:hypothetical protein CEUSTIGMA_g402.t1 [Chlamydomonas eustigma]|uniref:Guanylate cyclase domain-containing protein n=1 Tax=Chlamydomonas eustigma TaxID=1157962 RepID=A0A250WQ32_9CHLO|nr:hypothetical protein CEUSTIGMA_g402.t1 [Chlamydomonas eustigma]|eukprot:GAX72947.1 hypothetical protein CEUSTIGMA_g402.t1 [Chlamydomonas eustigma]